MLNGPVVAPKDSTTEKTPERTRSLMIGCIFDAFDKLPKLRKTVRNGFVDARSEISEVLKPTETINC